MAQKKKVEAKAKTTKPVASAGKKATSKAAASRTAPKAMKKPDVQAAKAKKPVAPVKADVHAASRKAAPSKAAVKPVIAKKADVKPAVKPAVPAAAKPVQAAKPAAAAVAKFTPTPATLAMRAAMTGQASPVRAVPAIVNKPANQKLTAPLATSTSPATPKAIAEKAMQQRQMINAQKKPVSQRHGFKTNEFIVYPAHGVGRIVGIEEQEIAGMSLELFVITFDKEKLTLRVPTGKLATVGMRKLADDDVVKKAMETLKGRARVKRTMWSRRAQEYVAKINSGDLVSIAEVVRDLFRSEAQPEQSYSERQLYEDALDRMAREIAAVDKLDERGAVQRITEVLSKSAKGRRLAEGGADEAEVKAA